MIVTNMAAMRSAGKARRIHNLFGDFVKESFSSSFILPATVVCTNNYQCCEDIRNDIGSRGSERALV